MAKTKSIYVCQQCGASFAKWQGRCHECSTFGSVVEEFAPASGAGAKSSGASREEGFASAKALHHETHSSPAKSERISSSLSEVDRVLGGGFVPGSLLLFGGEPGIGKSTLLLQVLGKLAQSGKPCLYISGEESGPQVASRARRLGIPDTEKLKFLATSDLAEARACIEKSKPAILVMDSVQTLQSPEIESAAGSVSQVREVAQQCMEISKGGGAITMLVGHVTKDGAIAGPRLLEHMVDGVFYFELSSSGGYRLLRGQKNRFGATHELAVFEMSSKGLLQVENPSARFLAERAREMPGSAVVAHLEGSRPFLTEVQALTQRCYQGYPRRTVQSVD